MGIAQNSLLQILVHRTGSLAVLALDVGGDLLGDNFIALADQYISGGLSAAHLGERSSQRRITQVSTDTGNLFQHLVQAVDSIHLGQLRLQIGTHTAGDLMTNHINIHALKLGLKFGVLLTGLLQISSDGSQLSVVQTGVARSAL